MKGRSVRRNGERSEARETENREKGRTQNIRELRGASYKFRSIPGFSFFTLPLPLPRSRAVDVENFSGIYVCAPFETYVRVLGARGRIRLDWLRGKDFVEFELETKCRGGFQPRLPPLLTLSRGWGAQRTEGNSTEETSR